VRRNAAKRTLGLAAGVLCLLGVAAGPARAETATIELKNGDKVTGKILERTPDHVVLEHPVLGRLVVPGGDLAPSVTHPGILGTSFLEGWTKELNIGLGGSYGDTDEADLRIGGLLQHKTDRIHWRLDARYELSFGDGEIDDHNAHVTTLRDWLWPQSRWFAFTYGIYDYDDFENWKHRLTFGGGPAYHLLPGPTFELDARAGPFLTYEFGDEDNARPEGAAGLFATWRIGEGHTLELLDVYFQTLDEGAFRNITNFAWRVRLDVESAVSVKLGIRNEYDSASDESKNNLKYFTAIAFDL
jgi:putative salt-induced outer membrane protein YdiY